jgi:hypothetical protein
MDRKGYRQLTHITPRRLMGHMRWAPLVTLCLLHVTAKGQPFGSTLAAYAPLLDTNIWEHAQLVAYTNVADVWRHPTQANVKPTVELRSDEDSDFTTVTIRMPNGDVWKTYCDSSPSPFAEEVYCGDLNGDKIPDFMIVKSGGGCGLAAEYCTGVFAFSEGAGFRFTRVRTMGLGPGNLIVNRTTHSVRFVHTSFRCGKTTDGRYHSFWIHRFFQWNGVAFQQDSRLPPVWIQYLYRPNHEPTRLLTSALKAKIWSEDEDETGPIEW